MTTMSSSIRLGEELITSKIKFVPHHENFTPDCPDDEWLSVVGKKAWIVFTRDKNIRRKPNELQALKKNKVIVLSSGQASAADTADLVVRLYPKLMRKLQNTKLPALFSVTLMGTISGVKL